MSILSLIKIPSLLPPALIIALLNPRHYVIKHIFLRKTGNFPSQSPSSSSGILGSIPNAYEKCHWPADELQPSENPFPTIFSTFLTLPRLLLVGWNFNDLDRLFSKATKRKKSFCGKLEAIEQPFIDSLWPTPSINNWIASHSPASFLSPRSNVNGSASEKKDFVTVPAPIRKWKESVTVTKKKHQKEASERLIRSDSSNGETRNRLDPETSQTDMNIPSASWWRIRRTSRKESTHNFFLLMRKVSFTLLLFIRTFSLFASIVWNSYRRH